LSQKKTNKQTNKPDKQHLPITTASPSCHVLRNAKKKSLNFASDKTPSALEIWKCYFHTAFVHMHETGFTSI